MRTLWQLLQVSSLGSTSHSPSPNDTTSTIMVDKRAASPWQLSQRSITCKSVSTPDVNLGSTWDEVITSAYCQCKGRPPTNGERSQWASKSNDANTRRIDVFIAAKGCTEGVSCKFTYSNPWMPASPSLPVCKLKTNRHMGAIFMLNQECPSGNNCDANRMNTHAEWMSSQGSNGWYHPNNPAWWKLQFQDAAYAGLQFLLPNCYGYDCYNNPTTYSNLNAAYKATGIKVGLQDDTWMWGKPWNAPDFSTLPDITNVAQTSKTLYTKKWKAFFQGATKDAWYTIDGRPLIYFYNAGVWSSVPQFWAKMVPVLRAMKALFKSDFGVEPFLVLDEAFWPGDAQGDVADAQFKWDTYTSATPNRVWRSTIKSGSLKGKKNAHALVKWDARARDGNNKNNYQRLVKGPEQLQTLLSNTLDAPFLVIGTWNDMGEGTGVGRNYDYYYKGTWRVPTYFMDVIRASQCQ